MRQEIMSSAYLFSSCVKWIGWSDDRMITRFGPGRRNLTIIHYCTDGAGYFNGNRVEKGQGFVIRPGDFEHYYSDEENPWSFFWLVIDTKEPESIFAYLKLNPATSIFDYGFVSEMRTLKNELDAARGSEFGTMRILLRLLEYHALENSNSGKHSASRKYATLGKQYIEMYYMNRITVVDVANSVGVSASYLYRCFMKEVGISPKRYLGDLRVSHAKRYLRSGEMNVTEVGRAVGYDDVLEFSRFFKSACGVSPAAFAKGAGAVSSEKSVDMLLFR